MINRRSLILLHSLPLFEQGCSTGMKSIVQTGVNETMAPMSPYVTEKDLEARRKPDPTPAGAEGQVHEVRISLADPKDSRFHACLEKAVASFQFEPQKSDTTVKYLFLRFDQESGLVKNGN